MFEKYYQVYGESGSLEEPLNDEWEVIKENEIDFDDDVEILKQISKLQKQLAEESRTSISRRRKSNLNSQINFLKSQLKNNDDLTITY